MLIAKGKVWDEFVEQIKATGYTGTTWMVWFNYDDERNSSTAHFFTDLDEARRFARGITAETMAEVFGDDAEGRIVRVEEDEWEDGEFIEIGFATWYGYEWKNGKWEVYC